MDHSWFTGKTTASPILIINRGIPSGSIACDVLENFNRIVHNYFGDHPPTDGKAYAENSDNGYEAVRLGTSAAHAFNSSSVLEYNDFKRITRAIVATLTGQSPKAVRSGKCKLLAILPAAPMAR